MTMSRYKTVGDAIDNSITYLKHDGQEVDAGHWQGVPTLGKPDLVTRELLSLSWSAPMPLSYEEAQGLIRPSSPWAELEHRERVGAEPRNPHQSLEHWPWWQGQEGKTMFEGMFSHTYSERMWPKTAGGGATGNFAGGQNHGIRYKYGDLGDLLQLLDREPQTRQAYLPIFFPEDTGAEHGGRIPCTLGYHFMLRNQKLHLWYDIRSCDAVRHFRDDVYLAVRLCHWVLEELVAHDFSLASIDPMAGTKGWIDVAPGVLTFNAHSFHYHMGDAHHLS